MLCVLGGKGGCGKTTVALGLGRALARAGRDPLVVGADTAVPGLRHRLGLDLHPSLDDVADGLPADRAARRSDQTGLFVLPAGRQTPAAGLDELTWDGPVVVDCPPGCGRAVAAPTRACGRSLLVTTGEPACLTDAEKTAALARRLGSPPVGVTLRTRGPRRPGRLAGHEPVPIPEVDDPPRSTRRLRQAFDRLRRVVEGAGVGSRGHKPRPGRNA